MSIGTTTELVAVLPSPKAVRACGGCGIAIIVGRDCYGVIISANVIAHDLRRGKARHSTERKLPVGPGAVSGSFVKETSDIVIPGNIFSGLDGEAIWVGGECPGLLISNNIVTDGKPPADEKEIRD